MDSFFWTLLSHIIGENMIWIFAAAAWVIFVVQLDKKNRKIALVMLVLFLLFFNPVSFKVLTEKILGENYTYYRFFWIFPMTLAFSYFAYSAVKRVGNEKMRLAIVIGICAGIIGMNITRDRLDLPENIYQIPTQTVEVADQLEAVMSENGEEFANVLLDTDSYFTLRQYDAHIITSVDPSGNSLALMIANNENTLSGEEISSIVEASGIEYIVASKQSDVSVAYMQELGWTVLAETEVFYILG